MTQDTGRFDQSVNEETKDKLLVEYLDLVDQYTVKRKLLSGGCSEGFLRLSRANYAAGGIKTKYGSDFYDNRMKAKRQIVIGLDETIALKQNDGTRLETAGQCKEKGSQQIPDPINMFGILVPQDFRVAQKEFNSVLNLCLDIINIVHKLGTLEIELREIETVLDDVTEN